MLARYGRTIPLALATLALTTSASAVRAQNTFNPYGNSGYADYREFTTPMYSNDPSLPGQARLQSTPIGGRSRANQFENYANSVFGREGDLSEGTRNGRASAGPGVPYYQAYRQYDEQYKRVYRPNDSAANRQFEGRMKQRDAAYAKALDEKDPVKRARLLRQIEQASPDRAAVTPSPSTRAPASAASRSTRAPAPPTSRAPAAPARAATPARTASPTPAPSAPSATSPAADASSIPIPPPR